MTGGNLHQQYMARMREENEEMERKRQRPVKLLLDALACLVLGGTALFAVVLVGAGIYQLMVNDQLETVRNIALSLVGLLAGWVGWMFAIHWAGNRMGWL